MRAFARISLDRRGSPKWIFAVAAACLACASVLAAQTPAPAAPPPQQTNAPDATSQTPHGKPAEGAAQAAALTEDQLRQRLIGKTFYLRGGYVDNNLHFDENGKLDGASPQASFTLSLVEITRVHVAKHRLELEGERYGLHFFGALPGEDQSTAFDKVRLTSKKKPLRITIDREEVIKAKKEKSGKMKNGRAAHPAPDSLPSSVAAAPNLPQEPHRGPTSTTSVEHANRVLESALDRVFSADMDQRMIATLPDYWQLYYKAAAAKPGFHPDDPNVLRQDQVERKAKLLAVFEPPSNDYAQKNGVAGIAMYHVVVGADGKPQQIAVGRPIGFGLDESAVVAIRKASFQPALKDGQPVPVLLDLLVEFRIYSQRTAAGSQPTGPLPAQPAGPPLPGPYSVPHPQ
jgi:TonB family protein